MLIRNNPVYDLEHRAYFIKGRNSRLFAISQKNGKISFFDLENNNRKFIDLERNLKLLAFSHNSGNYLGFVDDQTRELNVVDFEKNIIFSESLTDKTNNPNYQGYLSCYFDEDESHLWCVARLNAEQVEIQLRNVKNWEIVDKVAAEDTFSQSHFSFYSVHDPMSVMLWVAAGQDGTEIWWLENVNGKINYKIEDCLEDTTPPVFSPDKSEFLVLYEHEAFHQYQYPDIKRIGEYKLNLEGEEDMLGYSICYLNNDFALVISEYGLIFLLDTKKKKVVEEVIIENHEPMPINKIYPKLYDDTSLATDISYFERFGNKIVFVFDSSKDSNSRKDSLIMIPVEKFLLHIN